MRTHQLIVLCVLAMIFGNICFSQTVYFDRNRLDSLLLAGDEKTFLSLWEQLSAQAGIENMCNTEDEECFSNLHNKLTQLLKANDGRVQELCDGFEKSYTGLLTTSPGEKALIAYKKFEEAAKVGFDREAVEFYFIAVSLSNRHFLSEKRRLRTNYSQADNYRAGGKYGEALAMIDDFRKEDKTNRAYVLLSDSLTFLYNELERLTIRERGLHDLETSGEIVGKKLSVSMTYIFMDRSGNKNDMVLESHSFDNVPYEIFQSQNRGGFQGQIDFHFSPTVALGVRATSAQVYNIAPKGKGFEEIPATAKSTAVGLEGTYYFRNISGLRPYARIETGVIRVQRPRVAFSSSLYSSLYSAIWEADVMYPQIGVETGAEYEFGPKSLFFLGLRLYVYNHFGDTTLLNRFSFGIGVSGGINIL